MKMVVLEVKHGNAIVMQNDGIIKRLKNNNFYVGQEITSNMHFNFRIFKPIAAVAASLAFIFSSAYALLNIPTSFVTFDVNPSFEYACNIFNKVIDVEAKNQEAEDIVSKLRPDYRDIDVLIDETIDALTQTGYLKTDRVEEILLATSGYIKTSSEKLLKDASVTASQSALAKGINPHVISLNATMEDHDNAKKLGTTSGKIALINQYNNTVTKTDKVIPVRDLISKSVSDIVLSISKVTNSDNQDDNSINSASEDELNASEDENTTNNGATVLKEDDSTIDESTNKPSNDPSKDDNNSIPNSPATGDIKKDEPVKKDESNNSTTKNPDKADPPASDDNSNNDSKPVEPSKPPVEDDKQHAPDFGLDDLIDDALQI